MTRTGTVLRIALTGAAGALALAAGSAHAQSCTDRIDALRLAAQSAPDAVRDRSAFQTALDNASGWAERGVTSNCLGWVEEAEAELAPPQDLSGSTPDGPSEAEQRRTEAQDRAEARREAEAERADAVRERREARERAEAAADRRVAERRVETAEPQNRDDNGRSFDPEFGGEQAVDEELGQNRSERVRDARERALSALGFGDRSGDARLDQVEPEPVEGARDRLRVVRPAQDDRDTGVRQALADRYADADPLERAARRRLLGAPTMSLAELAPPRPRGERNLFGRVFAESPNDYDEDYDRHFTRSWDSQSDEARALRPVRFTGTQVDLDPDAAAAVRAIVEDFDGAGGEVIAVRGDSFDVRFADRAGRLVRALAEAGVSRADIEVLWGRTYGDNPDALQLAVLPESSVEF